MMPQLRGFEKRIFELLSVNKVFLEELKRNESSFAHKNFRPSPSSLDFQMSIVLMVKPITKGKGLLLTFFFSPWSNSFRDWNGKK